MYFDIIFDISFPVLSYFRAKFDQNFVKNTHEIKGYVRFFNVFVSNSLFLKRFEWGFLYFISLLRYNPFECKPDLSLVRRTFSNTFDDNEGNSIGKMREPREAEWKIVYWVGKLIVRDREEERTKHRDRGEGRASWGKPARISDYA